MSAPNYELIQPVTAKGVLVLKLVGPDLQDEETADKLQQELLSVVDDFSADRVILDFQKIRFLSSVSFKPLLHLRKKLLEREGRMILSGLSSPVGDIFYTTRMVSSSGSSAAPFEFEQHLAVAIDRIQRPS